MPPGNPMGLKEVLAKLKLVELDGEPARSTGAPGDSPELAELLARVPPPAPVDERKLARPAATPSAPPAPASGGELPGFAEIYRAAGSSIRSTASPPSRSSTSWARPISPSSKGARAPPRSRPSSG
jgi:hypothetical protein